MVEVHPSICRNCLAFCPILVTVEAGRATKVIGDPTGTAYEGYICPKGRTLPEQHNDPSRLLSAQISDDSGRFRPLASREAVSRIGDRLQEIVARDGPDAVALYIGTGQVSNPTGHMIASCFFRALKSRMTFSASTIDKPGANTSTALHGNWAAGAQRFEVADTWMIVGANPVIAKSNGLPFNNPGQRLKDAIKRGMKLIVIDPRKTETARRAHVHLQALPGEDSTLLAGMIRIIIDAGLHDHDFVAENARGFEELKQVVASFTPEYVAERAGVSTDDLFEAALTFGRGKIGGVVCSTGPSFAKHGDLTFYLALCLNTICGRWAREGMRSLPEHSASALRPEGAALSSVSGIREHRHAGPRIEAECERAADRRIGRRNFFSTAQAR
jgi:anaerobic selenocysteine-containing dehydrogenase